MNDEQRSTGESGAWAEGVGGTREGRFTGRWPLAANSFADAGGVLASSACQLDAEGHCITCSDEATPARVLSVDQETGLALVEAGDMTTEIDVTLVDALKPGEWVLVHGGVAIASLGEAIHASE